MKLRMNVFVLILIVLASIAVGYGISYKFGSNGVIKGAIPPGDFQFFLDKYNTLNDNYQKCVADAWNIQLLCKQQIGFLQRKLGVNSTAKANSTQ